MGRLDAEGGGASGILEMKVTSSLLFDAGVEESKWSEGKYFRQKKERKT